MMKKQCYSVPFSLAALAVLLVCAALLGLCSCGRAVPEGLWENADYLTDKSFGNGGTTVAVEVTAGEKTVTFTVKTDKKTLGDALFEHDLIGGEEGPYGLYLKTVNGITADYDVDQSYWSFTKNGAMMMTGVDGAEIADGEHYELVYTK